VFRFKFWQVVAFFASFLLTSIAHAETQKTRFGNLVADEFEPLKFQGLTVRTIVDPNNFLTFEGIYQFPGYDLVLVQNVGGSACPALFHIVKVTKRTALATREFGTCTDLIEVKRAGNSLLVTMRGFVGPFANKAQIAAAYKEKVGYLYSGGKLSKIRLDAAQSRK